MPSKQGKVALVGAGPGDEGLITVKGARLLACADVVVYDRLVGVNILAQISDTAEKIDVGKTAGNHPMPQESINKLLLQKAQEGKNVVRLKGGDPFLFGRGGEELELLAQNGIAFEVVPGVTSALSAPAYAGIPVTHRDFCSSLHIITGHGKQNSPADINYKSLADIGGTLVFLMSVSTIEQIGKGLIAAGMDRQTPCAIIENGTKPEQRKFAGKLEDIGQIISTNSVKSPAVVIVGQVCTLSDRFDWFSSRPLSGCRVIVTRPQKTAGKLTAMLAELGAQTTLYPCIETVEIGFELQLDSCDWLVFTSAVAVEIFFSALQKNGLDSRALAGKKIAVVGTQTAQELARFGIRADFIPTVFDGTHLATELISSGYLKKTAKVVLYRAKIGTEDIVEILKKNCDQVTDIPVYDTHFIKHENININEFDIVTFTSASCVQGFFAANENCIPDGITAVCIGQQTEAAARAAGFKTVTSASATIVSMADKVVEVYHGS